MGFKINFLSLEFKSILYFGGKLTIFQIFLNK